MQPVLLQLTGDADGGLLVALGDGQTAPARHRISPERAAAVLDAVEEALSVVDDVLIPGFDGERSDAEERAGRALSEVLQGADVARRLGQLIGEARGAGLDVVLVVDCGCPVWDAQPWELLCASPDGQPLEVAGDAVIVRLADGVGSGVTRRRRLRMLTWSPTPDETRCAGLLEHLETLGDCVAVPPDEGSVPVEDDGCHDLLHVVCHGASVAEGSRLLVDDSDRGLGTAAHLLGGALPRFGLVVLDVCEGGRPTARQVANLAGRFLATGARACVAPAEVAVVDACSAFAEGLHGALGGGAGLVAAVAAGRRQVRALAHPDPGARWSTFRLFVASLSVASGGPMVTAAAMPAGWPEVADDLLGLLDAAAAVAHREGAAHMGVEHLAMALPEVRGGGLATGLVRSRVLAVGRETWRDLQVGVVSAGPRPEVLPFTPRLVGWGAGLSSGAGLEDFWRVALADPGCGLHALPGDPLVLPASDDTLDSATWNPGAPAARKLLVGFDAVAGPARGLESVWGPEDGRRWEMAPGEVLGRASRRSTIAHPMYRHTATVDRALHRRQLTWRGQGVAHLHHAVRRVRRGFSTMLDSGDATFHPGDVVVLTAATWLRIV